MNKFTSFTKLFDDNFRSREKVEVECRVEELTLSHGDALQYEGKSVAAYLRRRKLSALESKDDGINNLPVVHLTCCKHIQGAPNKFYCTSFDKSYNGSFWIDAIDDDRRVIDEKSGEHELRACINCLSDLCSIPINDEPYLLSNMTNKQKLRKLSSNFDFNDFLETDYLLNPRIWHSYEDSNLKSGEWKSISKEVRSKANWICDECKESFEGEGLRQFLHTHHINQNSAFNHHVNLRPLCIECHAGQPNHGHMKENNLQYKIFMEKKQKLMRQGF